MSTSSDLTASTSFTEHLQIELSGPLGDDGPSESVFDPTSGIGRKSPSEDRIGKNFGQALGKLTGILGFDEKAGFSMSDGKLYATNGRADHRCAASHRLEGS